MKNEFKDLQERIIILLDHLGYSLNKNSFAKKVEINPRTLAKTYSKETLPSLKLISKIASYFPQANYNWLLTGVGTLNKSTAPSAIESELIDLYRENKNMKDKIIFLLEEKIEVIAK